MSIEDQVRVRVADALRSAGVNEGRVGVEVLYMLPKEFVRAYEELWYEIHGYEQVASGSGGGGDGRSLGLDEASVKRDEAKIRKEGGKDADGKSRGVQKGGLSTRAGYGVGGGGKRYKANRDGMRVGMSEKSEEALEVKRLVDRKLMKLVRGVREGVVQRMERSQGGTPGWVRVLENGREACGNCGKLVARDWVRCPYCNA